MTGTFPEALKQGRTAMPHNKKKKERKLRSFPPAYCF
nr:MAG TPA: hypothetical protein [Caudoviricetes sp.]